METFARILEFVCEFLRLLSEHRQTRKIEDEAEKEVERIRIQFDRDRIRDGDRRRVYNIARRMRIK